MLFAFVIFCGLRCEAQLSVESCLHKIDSIATAQTFREAIVLSETCLSEFPKSVNLRLELAEYYLLQQLVDGDEKGVTKAARAFDESLTIDPTFATTQEEFGLSVEELKRIRDSWIEFGKAERTEEFLIWALIHDFEKGEEPK